MLPTPRLCCFVGISVFALWMEACGKPEPAATLTATEALTSAESPAAQAPAAPSALPTVERQLLILTGGTDAATVEQWMAKHSEPLAELYGGTEPLPIIQSDGIEGLKPGFFILAPSVCPAEQADEAFYAALHEIPGSYVRTVQVPEDFGACRSAKITDWWVLRFSEDRALCNVWREKLAPVEEVYIDDPNVIPPPPEGTVDLPFLNGPCPEQWSAVVSQSGSQMLLQDHTSLHEGGTLRVYRIRLDGADGGASTIEAGAPFEMATFDGDAVMVHFVDHSVPQATDRVEPGTKVELVYKGSLATIFAAAGLTDREVKGLDQSEVRAEVWGGSAEVFACVAARWEGARWVEQSRRIVGVAEGSLPPYCTDTTPVHNRGFRDSALKGGWVPEALIGELNRVAGAPEHTQWHFAGMSGVGKGDFAVSTHTEIGSHLTGFAVAWDGKTARKLKGLQGTVKNFRDLDHGRVLVCTDKGHGAYQSRTGEQLWWKRGPRCPVVFKE